MSRGEERPRAAPRSTMILSAVVQSPRGTAAATIRNLSSSGAMVEVSSQLSPGDEILLRRGSLEVGGVVAWCFDGRAGISLRDRIEVSKWAARRQGACNQAQVDHVVATARATLGTTSSGESGAGKRSLDQDVLNSRLAEEILLVARTIELLGDEIAEEPLFVARHGQSLQQIDIAVQVLGHVARIITAEDPNAAISEIGMQALVARLCRKSL
ncbi:MAG TPA: PilZ domain-containing protein [Sphingomicrobium sp.]|nr:PilZ domain-containing protein [Sphingomicrobium sp.]